MFNKFHNKRAWIVIFAAIFAITLLTGNTFARAEKAVLLSGIGESGDELLLAKSDGNSGNAYGWDKQKDKFSDDDEEDDYEFEEEEFEDDDDEHGQGNSNVNGNSGGNDDEDEEEEELEEDDSEEESEDEETPGNGNGNGNGNGGGNDDEDEDEEEEESEEDDSEEESEDEETPGNGNGNGNGNGGGNDDEDEAEEEEESEEDDSEDEETPGNGNGNGNGNGGENDNSGGNGEGNGNGSDEETVIEEVSSDSSLVMIYIGDKQLPGFKSDKTEYTYQLPKDTTSLPKILAVPTDENATVHYEKLTFLPDQMTITVTAEDGVSETHYKLNLGVKGLAPGEIIYLEELVPVVTEILGLWLPPTEDGFVLEKKCSKIRFWVSEHLLYPQIWILEEEAVKYAVENEGTDEESSSIAIGDPKVIIGTSELKTNTGNGKHSRSDVENGDGGYYKYNFKGKNFPELVVGENYILAVMNEGQVVMFGEGNPAILHFTVGEFIKSGVNERNKTLNETVRRSNVSSNR